MPFSFCVNFDWSRTHGPCDLDVLRRKLERAVPKARKGDTLPNTVLRLWLFSDAPLALWQVTGAETTVVSALQDAAVLNGGHVAELHCYNARSGILPERLECIVDVSYP